MRTRCCVSLSWILAGTLLLASCAPQPTAAPAVTPELSPTVGGASPAPASPPVPTPIAVPGATQTTAPSPTAVSAPTVTPAGTAGTASLPAAMPAAVLRKGPDLVFTGDNTQMKVVWQLDTSQASALLWGTDLSYSGGSAATSEYDADHQQAYTITGLRPGTKYDYRVIAGAAASAGSFYTAPDASATDLSFFAYGDTRTGTAIHDLIAADVISTYTADPAFQTLVLVTGDLVSSGDEETSWTAELFDPRYRNIRTVLANVAFSPVMGNHEGAGRLFAKYFPMPFVAGRYWSFDYGPAHVVMLDQYTPYRAGSPQYAWLEKDLAATGKEWKFIVLHEPGWSALGVHPDNPTVQADIEPLAERYGVAMVLGGHLHYYARAMVNGVVHLTLGGGGAPLYTPEAGAPDVVKTSADHNFAEFVIHSHQLTGTVLTPAGTVIETFSVMK